MKGSRAVWHLIFRVLFVFQIISAGSKAQTHLLSFLLLLPVRLLPVRLSAMAIHDFDSTSHEPFSGNNQCQNNLFPGFQWTLRTPKTTEREHARLIAETFLLPMLDYELISHIEIVPLWKKELCLSQKKKNYAHTRICPFSVQFLRKQTCTYNYLFPWLVIFPDFMKKNMHTYLSLPLIGYLSWLHAIMS